MLRFRPRRSFLSPDRAPPPSPVNDLRKYEQPAEPDDFRQRMKVNGLALVATIILVVAGIWIAETMAQMRKNQDCVLTGRSGCTPIKVPIAPR